MPSSALPSVPPRSRAVGRLLLFVAFLVAASLAARYFGLLEYASVDRLGEVVVAGRGHPWAAPIFVLTYVAVATLGLPGTPMTLAGGAIFGVAAGTGLNWLGATLGATGAYLIARGLGRDAVRSLLGARANKLDALTGDGAFASLVRLRLIPVVPFNALNFGAGLAGVRFTPYLLSTALGIIPGTAVYTYFADALIGGVAGARSAAFVQVLIAGALLVALSFVPALARRLGWITALVITVGAAPATLSAQRPDHAPFSAMLAAHVTDGMVDYDAFRRDPRFPAYLKSLDRVSPEKLPTAEQLAYWINVYNAYTIELINAKGERKSIRNINKVLGVPIRSPWAEPIVRAGGRVLTLDDVEHKIIRPTFKDPRIHVALVCAAVGCPPIRGEAYEAATLEAQLDDQARRFLAQRGKNRVDVRTRTVYGSPIFTWYREDFGNDLRGVGAFWANYVEGAAERALLTSGEFKYVDTEYDWSLNVRRR